MEEKNELKRVLGFGDLMSIGIGQIIGSGIMALTGICIALTGAGTPLAFITAAALVICPDLVLAILGSAVPATGGMYTYVRDYIGRKTGFYYLALLVAGQLVLAMFGITFAEYAVGIFPGLNKTAVAFGILTLCFVLNILGVDIAAKLQNFLVIVLIGAMTVFIAFGLPKVDWSVFSGGIKTIMPNGFISFMTGASLLTFATGGAEFLSELGGEMKNPGRDLPRAMILSTDLRVCRHCSGRRTPAGRGGGREPGQGRFRYLPAPGLLLLYHRRRNVCRRVDAERDIHLVHQGPSDRRGGGMASETLCPYLPARHADGPSGDLLHHRRHPHSHRDGY